MCASYLVTGRTADRGTFFHDVFRKKWVFSIKGYHKEALAQFGRHRMYFETPDDDPFGDYEWADNDPVYWAAADTLDQPGVCPGNCLHPELYTLDVSPYESLHVMFYTMLRGESAFCFVLLRLCTHRVLTFTNSGSW